MSPVVLHSITRIAPEHAGRVVVTGSHGGLYAAAVALRHGVDAVLFNDASGGRDGAGVAGITWLGVAAAAVSHLSAPIGDGEATLRDGILSAVNEAARARGCEVGQKARMAVALLERTAGRHAGPTEETDATEARYVIRPGVVALDSVSLVTPEDRDMIIVTGSHGALLGGDPASAVKYDVRGAVYNDAGRGPGGRGATRLPALAARGIPAVTVAAGSARIGDGRSTYEDGIVTVVNEPAQVAGVRPGMSVPDFIERIERPAR